MPDSRKSETKKPDSRMTASKSSPILPQIKYNRISVADSTLKKSKKSETKLPSIR